MVRTRSSYQQPPNITNSSQQTLEAKYDLLSVQVSSLNTMVASLSEQSKKTELNLQNGYKSSTNLDKQNVTNLTINQ